MQKVQSYLYPNRVLLLADLAGFTVENRVVYARTIKIYNGIDNILEFDIQNADQKRIDLTTISDIKLNIMDATGNSLPNSPYTLSATALKGIAKVVIPQDDLTDLADQYLHYSVTAVDSDSNDIILYCDSQFGAVGNIHVMGNAMPTFRDDRVYDKFVGEINYMGNVTNHTPAIPCKFYEATPTEYMDFEIYLDNFIGDIWVEATEDMTIAVSSFTNATRLQSFSCTTKTTTTVTFNNVPVSSTGGQNNYMRVSWQYPNVWQYGSQQDPTLVYGSITKVVASSN